MKRTDRQARLIRRRLSRTARLPHEAAALGYELFRAMSNDHLVAEEKQELLKEYVKFLERSGMQDLLREQILYAERLALYDGPLEYEEMHKLYSLCDEIKALSQLGLSVSTEMWKRFEDAVAHRLRRESRKARLVAEDKVEPQKKDWWWYKSALEG
jgi:hypothetical protein